VTRQPALFDTPPARVPHPGSACCDPTQDLAGWIATQRARIARDRRWARAWRTRGDRLRREGTRAWAASAHTTGRDLDAASVTAHGTANAWAQRALMRAGDVDRIETAHAYRLETTP
jgi:hypothetical protein